MSARTLILGAIGALALFLATAAARPATAVANTAEKYFGCPTGYSFQVSGSSARCYVAGTASTANIFCGVGYVKAIDQFNGGRDACQHQMTNAVGNYTCPSGYSSTARPGPDVCTKPATPSILAPAVAKYL
ncbi:MAG: hypothetical protein IT360_19020 [Gemmatimonadaceae bacterium]|nr:hypothetical protein [Gemmatimonadaceae bacterium]